MRSLPTFSRVQMEPRRQRRELEASMLHDLELRYANWRSTMAPKERKFPVHELIIALLRDQNIHEGYWGSPYSSRPMVRQFQPTASL